MEIGETKSVASTCMAFLFAMGRFLPAVVFGGSERDKGASFRHVSLEAIESGNLYKKSQLRTSNCSKCRE